MELALNHINVHYEVLGEGRPIIILPGWGGDTRGTAAWLEPAFAERQGWKRIYVDPPGHGGTPARDWITNQDSILEVVLGFIDRVTDGQRFALAGVSLGGYLARGVVFHRANLVDGLLLEVPVIHAEDARRTRPPAAAVVEDPGFADQLTPAEAEMLSGIVVRTQRYLTYYRTVLQSDAKNPGDEQFLDRIRQNPALYSLSFDVDALPQPFEKPTLIITGRQDSVVGYQDAWKILDRYPRATYVVFDRAGHWMEEKEALFKLLVQEWLERVEESAGY